MKKATLSARIRYWFDNRLSKGSLGLIKLLTVVTAIMAVLLSAILHIWGIAAGEKDTYISDLWNSIATIINKWFPSYEDGWIGYRVIMTLNAIFGLFVTSILIAIISTAIMEKVEDLKKSNVPVVAKDHVVILGFRSGEYTLIQELINGADNRAVCIVVAGEADRDVIENDIRNNVICPKNVRIVCRSINIFDPQALEICSLGTCRTILVSPTDNSRTVRILVAVTRVLSNVSEHKATTIAVVSGDDFHFPESIAEKYNILLLHTNETIARVIAHSCTMPGLSQTMLELFHFEGSELHLVSLPGMTGLTFEQSLCRVDDAAPVGICKGKRIYIKPEPDMVIEEGDSLLVFCEENDSAKLVEMPELRPLAEIPDYSGTVKSGRVAIIGCNEFLPTIVSELPENVTDVILADVDECYRDEILASAASRNTPINVIFYEKDINENESLEEFAKMGEHFILMSSHAEKDDSSDLMNIFRNIALREIRDSNDLHFNITMELRQETNEKLMISDTSTEFVVSSLMSSLFLAQLSESPELISAFDELLTNEGCEVFLRTAEELHCDGTWTVLDIRRRILPEGYVMIGYMDSESMTSYYDLPLKKSMSLRPEDMLIVIGEN